MRTDSQPRVILVTGATGRQGGATLRHLAGREGPVLRGLTRKPESPAAQALRALGVEMVKGDLDDAASVAHALDGVWGVFAVQNSWEAGVAGEEEQGKRLVALARAAGVEHFVYSSVASANRATGVPHFDSKSRIEDALRAAAFPFHTIVRPVYFMENLTHALQDSGSTLRVALQPHTQLQMVATDDIGRFGAAALSDPRRWNRAEVEIAGDFLSLTEAARLLAEVGHTSVSYEAIPIEAVRKSSEDAALMMQWLESVGFSADISGLEERWGIRPLTLREWLADGASARASSH